MLNITTRYHVDISTYQHEPITLYFTGHSRFKVSVGGAGLSMANNYCKARGGNLGAPRNDYEYVQVLKLFQGQR